MQTTLSPALQDNVEAREAAALIRACVHCGFCQATCPTYQVLGDERDSPRGRIHLIKQLLEGEGTSAQTQLHLDRCLTCRACETACPSGVQYGRLVELGRGLLVKSQPRPWLQRLLRRSLADALTGPLFAPAAAVGRLLRPLLPAALQTHLPVRLTSGALPQRMHARSVLLLAGCVQPALAPQINAATSRVLDALGITVRIAADAGCCGAIHQHLDASEQACAAARRNIDAWWPAIDAGAEAIVANTSGCGSMLRDYAVLLQHDEVYAARAARVVGLVRDLSEVVAPLASQLRPLLKAPVEARVVFQAPCSLQHAQRIRGSVEGLLSALGATLLAAGDAQLCCGAAGTYTLLQPQISTQLRQRKQAALTVAKPQIILSANLGCMLQLAAGSAVPVQHWVEWVDSQLV